MTTTQSTPPAIEFANTVVANRGRVRDGLDDWLARNGLVDGGQFHQLRDAVRALLAAATGDSPFAATDLAVVNAASAAAPCWPVLAPAANGELAVHEESAGPDHTAEQLAALARDAVRLLGGPHRPDLRACQGPGCVQFFLKDHPRREWCGPSCGNRARAARHYARHREQTA
ncbi:CGNR zinc finger domain-containing protein [Kitasatospora sp. LaBMicrA B282]|uniref:CGNR zinc finger domain-containing protein n=1 Tax=Kitasatospora sp. LaBMicrA B282 TaxID=3420949 RepID=UPI003D0C0DF7